MFIASKRNLQSTAVRSSGTQLELYSLRYLPLLRTEPDRDRRVALL
jgi:hypothetical protein